MGESPTKAPSIGVRSEYVDKPSRHYGSGINDRVLHANAHGFKAAAFLNSVAKTPFPIKAL
jgi:hypothetical protein